MNLLRTLFFTILLANGVATAAEEAPVVEVKSAFSYAESLARLKEAMNAAHLTIFAEIDHAAGAASVGMSMPPTIVLIYGNPKGGTPLMLQDPKIALDLPLRVLLRQDAAGNVLIAYHPIAALAPAQALLVKAVS